MPSEIRQNVGPHGFFGGSALQSEMFAAVRSRNTGDLLLVPVSSILRINQSTGIAVFKGALDSEPIHGQISDDEIVRVTTRRTVVPPGLVYEGRAVLWIETDYVGGVYIATLADDGSGVVVLDETDVMHSGMYQKQKAADPDAVEQAAARAVDPAPSAKTAQ